MRAADEPFPGSWAVAAGSVSRWELRHNYDRVYPDVYVRKGVTLDPVARAKAAVHWAKGDAVLVGRSAAAMHACRWLDPDRPAEIALRAHHRTPPGIVGRRDSIAARDICHIDGFRVTTPVRTGYDLGRRLDRTAAVILLDALCQATGIGPDQIGAYADEHSGGRGVRRLRAALDLVDAGAESPQETRTRLVLVDDGLPRPSTQVRIRDAVGRVVARVDLAWESWRVAVEYDGAQHWTDESQRTWDIERAELLRELGWCVVRVNSEQLRSRPWLICDRVRAALRRAGAPSGL
ncbi:endonuclease domain-containing protein [Skermania piniformis]|uniref:DUF559 domain-containing protein n=1 Tax=Skermania pinensis TaxID=39122 RepID=A0ABX8SBS0_9ACTN|nr:DUF559 domain-containing protein [Skermania piniformis]QXQ15309.1 DUF559 domain-containing protein [Skermania piniformis]